jgi:hypothetical protein
VMSSRLNPERTISYCDRAESNNLTAPINGIALSTLWAGLGIQNELLWIFYGLFVCIWGTHICVPVRIRMYSHALQRQKSCRNTK